MTFELIEPKPRRISNSERRRQIASQAHQCAKWLRISGFEVVSVCHGLFIPRIVIKHNPALCDTLEGIADAYERTPSETRHFRYVLRFDVRVEWEVAPEPIQRSTWVERVTGILKWLRAAGGAACSRLMNPEQHKQLMLLRGNVARAVQANSPDETQRTLGIVQGFMLGLHAAGEIDADDVRAFDADVQRDLALLYAARDAARCSHAH